MYCNLRDQQVRQMINNIKAEGLALEHVDILMLNAYVAEKIGGIDLLAHAQQFKTMSAYHYWCHSYQKILIDDPTLETSVEYILSEFQKTIRHKSKLYNFDAPNELLARMPATIDC
jgi:hypothetical protein